MSKLYDYETDTDEWDTMEIEVPELEPFFDDGWLRDILFQLKSDKEATVYCCEAGPSTGVDLVAAKVYRPIQSRGFKNDTVYQEGRVILKKNDAQYGDRSEWHGQQTSRFMSHASRKTGSDRGNTNARSPGRR